MELTEPKGRITIDTMVDVIGRVEAMDFTLRCAATPCRGPADRMATDNLGLIDYPYRHESISPLGLGSLANGASVNDFDQAIEQLRRGWDAAVAQQFVSDLTTAVWKACGPDEQAQGWATALRRMMRERLAEATSSAQRLALLNLSYQLEQGLGNRDPALELAVQAEALSRQTAAPLERVRAVFQLAKALLYLDRKTEAVRWTRKAMQLGDQLEQAAATAGSALLSAVELNDLRRLLADQESRQVCRLAGLAGMEADLDRAAESAITRWEKLDDLTGFAAGLGMLVEARAIQGRWEDAATLARRAVAMIGYPQRKDPGLAYVLCFGGWALCHLGDPQTALAWTTDAASISHEIGNQECIVEAHTVHAVALAAAGRLDEAVAEIERAAREVEVLHMVGLAEWVSRERSSIRRKAALLS